MDGYTEYNALVNESGVKIYAQGGARIYRRVSESSKARVLHLMTPDGFLRKNKPEKECPAEFVVEVTPYD